MKKQGLFAVLFALCLTLSACGCGSTTAGDPVPSTTNATTPSTSTATTPTTNPTMATNIPDPTVDSNSTENGGLMGTDGATDGTTGSTNGSRGVGGNTMGGNMG